jgi:hypothetical protein
LLAGKRAGKRAGMRVKIDVTRNWKKKKKNTVFKNLL